MNQKTIMEMRTMLDSMEEAIKARNRADRERRAKKAEREREEFEEKLMRAVANKAELERMASKVKGSDNVVQRDQLVSLLTTF